MSNDPAEGTAALSVRDLSKRFGDRVAFEQVSSPVHGDGASPSLTRPYS